MSLSKKEEKIAHTIAAKMSAEDVKFFMEHNELPAMKLNKDELSVFDLPPLTSPVTMS